MKRRLAVPCCSVAPAPAAFGCRPASPAHGSSLSLCRGSAVRGGRGDSPPCASPRRWLPGGSLLLCCTCAPTRERRETKEHRPPSSAPRSVRSLGDVRGEEGGGKAGSGREERHEERAGEKEEARQGAARSRWGAPSCRAGFGVSASLGELGDLAQCPRRGMRCRDWPPLFDSPLRESLH